MVKRVLRRILSSSFGNKHKGLIFGRRARAAGLTFVAGDSYFDLEKDNKILRLGSSHTVYLRDMIDNFDHYMNSVVPVKEGLKQITDFSGPRHHRLVGFDEVAFLFPSLTEPYATTQEYLDFAGLQEGNIVLDIGAYSAVTSIIFAQLAGPTGHVYSFEPDESNYKCANSNVEMARKAMGITNITLQRKAIWSHNDGILFSNEGAMGSSAVAITGGGRGEETLIPSTTLESFLNENGITKVDFVKIDIEGGETELLKRSANTLRKLGARLIIEPHRVGGKLNTGECCKLLEAAGYSVHVRDKTPGSEALIEARPH
jgi:FkbM family methyltransferase